MKNMYKIMIELINTMYRITINTTGTNKYMRHFQILGDSKIFWRHGHPDYILI